MNVENNEDQYDLENNYFPRDLSYSSDKKEIYERLQDGDSSTLKGRTFAEIFMYAVIYGYKNKENPPLVKPIPQIPSNAFSKTNKSLMLAIMISQSSKGIEVLVNRMEVKKELEQYANGGISILESVLTSGRIGDAVTQLEKEMRGLLKTTTEIDFEEKKEELKRGPEASKLTSEFEFNLRLLIPKILGNITTDNWEDSLPNNGAILKVWKTDKERNENAAEMFNRTNLELIDYSHISQLHDIIINTDLWKSFEPIFTNLESFSTDIRKLTKIRNDPQHARGVTADQLDLLRATLKIYNANIKNALEKL